MKRLLVLVVMAAWLVPALPATADAASAKNLRVGSLTCSAVTNELGWSKDLSLTFSWTGKAKGAVRGFSYTLAVGEAVVPDASVETTASGVSFDRETMPPVVGPGDWWGGMAGDFRFTVVAVGAKGRTGTPVTLQVKNDPYPLTFWRDDVLYNGQPEPDLISLCFNVTVTLGDWDSFINPVAAAWYRDLSVDGGSWTRDLVVPAPADHSNDGRHEFEYRVWSEAGVATSLYGDVIIDTIVPVSRVVPDDGLPHNGADFAFELAEANPWDHWASLDGGLPEWVGDGAALPWAMTDGVHEITLWGVDAAGNAEAEHAVEIEVDHSLPPAGE